MWNAAQADKEPEGKEMGYECGVGGCKSTKFIVRVEQTRSADEGSTMFTKCVKCKAFGRKGG